MKDVVNTGILTDLFFNNNEIPHSHKYWEIIYYTCGTVILKVGETEINIEPGLIVFQPPHIAHSERSNEGYKSAFIAVENLQGFDDRIPQFRDNENKDILQLMLMVHREYQKSSRNWSDITNALLETISRFLSSWSGNHKPNPYVEQLENILVDNILNKNFDMQQVYQSIPVSANHLRTLFKKETGWTPLEYLTEKKIEHAKYLLGHGDTRLPFKEIAERIGMDNPYYFSRVFKKITGSSPRTWATAESGTE